MNYILDTNVLINMKRAFPFSKGNDFFWDFVASLAQSGFFKIPEAVIDELINKSKDKNDKPKEDLLGDWVKTHKEDIKLATKKILENGSLNDILSSYNSIRGVCLTESELEILNKKADPYVIAHALTEKACLITDEIKGGISLHTNINNVQIPNICDIHLVSYRTGMFFIWELSQKYTEFCRQQASEV